jgi:arylsulfatase A
MRKPTAHRVLRGITFWLIALTFGSLLQAQPASKRPPNVVLILIDDLSHYGITAYGADKIGSTQGLFEPVKFATPRIDSLAREGLLARNAFAHPLCEPTRIALMSGKNNNRNFLAAKSQHESDITFGDVFKRAGYTTAITGKWKQSRGSQSVPAADYISRFGWDQFACFDVVGAGRRMIDPGIVTNGKEKNHQGIDPETGRRWYGPEICNRFALNFIDENKDKPFFLYYPMILVHAEHTPTPDTQPKSAFDEFQTGKGESDKAGDDRRYFPDMIAYMDKEVGKLLDKLDEHGLKQNTIVVLMGDNGTKECFFHLLPDGTKYPGYKGTTTDNGNHVPLLVRYPPKIKPGTVYQSLVNVTDIFPTLAEAAGVEIPNAEDLDGISFWPQATGKSGEHRDHIYTWYNANRNHKELDELLVYAHTTDFKRYAPDRLFPSGRFFDLRTDVLEHAGKPLERKGQKTIYSGLDIAKLTPEQRAAYAALGKIIEANVIVSVEKLVISSPRRELRPGEQTTLSITLTPNNATRNGVIWHSSDASIATIDKFGVVKAIKPGKVEIKAYSWEDAQPTADVKKAPKEYRTDGIQASVLIEVLQGA